MCKKKMLISVQILASQISHKRNDVTDLFQNLNIRFVGIEFTKFSIKPVNMCHWGRRYKDVDIIDIL